MSYASTFNSLPTRRRERKQIREVFDIDAPATALVEVYADRTQFVPEIDPTYVFDKKQVKKVLQWLSGKYKKNLLLTGPTGCGKSSLPEQVAARLGIEVFRVACHGKMEFPEILGANQLVNAGTVAQVEDDGLLKKAAGVLKAVFRGSDDGESLLQYVKRIVSSSVVTNYVYGPAINASSRFDGGILLLDEGNFLHPSTFGALNTVLDNGPLLIPETGEIIYPKPGFRIAVTGNSMDGGDDMALHKGVQRMNVALMNRFLTMRCDYMDPLQEAKVLGKTVSKDKVPGHIISTMIKTANDARAAFKNGIIETVISTRTLVTWAKLVQDDQLALQNEPEVLLAETLGFALLDGTNPVDAAAITTNLTKSIEENPAPVIPLSSTSSSTAGTGTGQFTVHLLVSENNGSPKIWGVYTALGSTAESLFYGSLTGNVTNENKQLGYFANTRGSKLNPPAGKSQYKEVTSFLSAVPSSDIK